jgi:hypothetical protein
LSCGFGNILFELRNPNEIHGGSQKCFTKTNVKAWRRNPALDFKRIFMSYRMNEMMLESKYMMPSYFENNLSWFLFSPFSIMTHLTFFFFTVFLLSKLYFFNLFVLVSDFLYFFQNILKPHITYLAIIKFDVFRKEIYSNKCYT